MSESEEILGEWRNENSVGRERREFIFQYQDHRVSRSLVDFEFRKINTVLGRTGTGIRVWWHARLNRRLELELTVCFPPFSE
jgi:hypothetical protein